MIVIHVFHDVHMGLGIQGLTQLLTDKTGKELKQGELAVFVNKKWGACKILAGSALLHHKPDEALTIEAIKKLPLVFGGKRLAFIGGADTKMHSAFEKYFGKSTRLKVVTG